MDTLEILKLLRKDWLTQKEKDSLSGVVNLKLNTIQDLPPLMECDFSRLENLKMLNLSGTNIEYLPLGVSKLNNLTNLYLSNTPFKAFPDSIALEPLAKSLISLHLNGTEIDESTLKCLRLEKLAYLDISNTKVKSVPENIYDMECLETLNLRFNDIENSSIENIIKLQKLEKLFLTFTNVSKLPDGISHLEKLKRLDISFTDIKELPTLSNKIRISIVGTPLELENHDDKKYDTFIDLNLFQNNIRNILMNTRLYIRLIDRAKSDQDSLIFTVSEYYSQKNRTGEYPIWQLRDLLICTKDWFVDSKIQENEYLLLEAFSGAFQSKIANRKDLETLSNDIKKYSKFMCRMLLESVLKYISMDILYDPIHMNRTYDSVHLVELISCVCNDYSKNDGKGLELKFKYIDIPQLNSEILERLHKYANTTHTTDYRFTYNSERKKINPITLSEGDDRLNSKVVTIFKYIERGVEYKVRISINDSFTDKLRIKLRATKDRKKVRMSIFENGIIEKIAFCDLLPLECSEDSYNKLRDDIISMIPGNEEEIFELLYLYVEGLYSLEPRQYTLSHEYNIKLFGNKTDAISIEKGAPIRRTKEFFSPVTNINAFVGKNGSGKSSIIDLFLTSNIFDPFSEPIKNVKYIIVFRHGRNIYWSGEGCDWSVYSKDFHNIYEISPRSKFNDYYRIINTKIALISNVVDPQRIKMREPYKNVNPRKIILTTENMLSGGEIQNADVFRLLNLYLFIKKALESDNGNSGLLTELSYLKEINFFYHDEDQFTFKTNSSVAMYIEELEEELKSALPRDMFAQIYSTLEKDCFFKAVQLSLLNYYYKENQQDVEEFSYLYKQSLVFQLTKRQSFSLEEISIKDLVWVIEAIEQDRFLKNHVSVAFANMSSGESARATLFAKILSIFWSDKRMPDSLKYRNGGNYILMFDEAEVYFHPAWQRTLISDLIEFLNVIKNDSPGSYDNLMIYLSSNSPFILSDLPGNNIIYFGPGSESLNDEKEKTFGQSIQMLLRRSFFMEEGVIGKFAVGKITYALNKLDSKKKELSSGKIANGDISKLGGEIKDEFLEYIMDILGEPILRDAINDKYTELKDGIKEKYSEFM